MKLYIKSLLTLSVLSLTACSAWLDIEPEGQATGNKLFKSGDGYRTALAGIYTQMSSPKLYGKELQFAIVDCLAQQYTWNWYYSTTNDDPYRAADMYDMKNAQLIALSESIWDAGYNVIANANSLIKSVQTANPSIFAGGEIERDLILGEAYACRALMHFDLARVFAPAPIEKEPGTYLPYVETHPNIQPMSIELEPYMEKVVADLNKALELTARFDTTALGMAVSASAQARFEGQLDYGMEGYQKESSLDGFFTKRGYRMSYYSINALLARVHQYLGNNDKAFEYADKVMKSVARGVGGTTLEMYTRDEWWSIASTDRPEDRPDLKVVSNIIFGIYNGLAYDQYDIASHFMKSVEGQNYGRWFSVDIEGQKVFRHPTTEADESENDYRRRYQIFQPMRNGRVMEVYLSAKFYPSFSVTLRDKNLKISPVIRTTEMRYIIAEYHARKGDFAQAYQILNEIRRARSLYNELEVSNSLEGFLRDMVRDAQREWISEGQLLYLYKRLRYDVQINRMEKRPLNKSEYMLPIPVNQNI